MKLRHLQVGALALATVLFGACASMGTGTGQMRGGGGGVRFDWKADSATKGHMNATFANGDTYSGQMFQITSATTVDDIRPMWMGWPGAWGRHWGGWPYWYEGPQFITHYSGRVVANLKDPNGDAMRCRFRLVNPTSGMSGGGAGKCQLSDGRTIDATFPAA